MAHVNPSYEALQAGYLFPEIARRTGEFIAANPGVELIRLGIGDTTQPLTPTVVEAMHGAVEAQADARTYTGYGPERGNAQLREAIAKRYVSYGVSIEPHEVFVGDGAKTDSANIQSIFDPKSVVAVQDPSYPVYVDTAVIGGKTTGYDHQTGRYRPCLYGLRGGKRLFS